MNNSKKASYVAVNYRPMASRIYKATNTRLTSRVELLLYFIM